jgi:hypothetical protein
MSTGPRSFVPFVTPSGSRWPTVTSCDVVVWRAVSRTLWLQPPDGCTSPRSPKSFGSCAEPLVTQAPPLKTWVASSGPWPRHRLSPRLSSANGNATATSDLDIVVLLAGPPAPYRETIRVEEIPVELFVHTSNSKLCWYERERSEGRCTLAHMLATGVALTGPETEATQAEARRWIAVGPEPWTAEQLDKRRYALTDALDDLVGANDYDERDAVAGQVLLMVAELALNLRGAWQGRGKWVVAPTAVGRR